MELVVGRIAKAHGIHGELVVEVRTDDPESRFTPGAGLMLTPRGRPGRAAVVESVRPHGARLLVRLAGVADRDAAEELRGALLTVDSAALPPTGDPDEFYDHQLEGLLVSTASGAVVGTVTEVVHTAGAELLAVRTGAGGEVLIPFVSAIVTSVSLADGTVVVDPPEGLLELES